MSNGPNQQPMMPPPGAQGSGAKVLIWIAAGCGIVFIVMILAMVFGGFLLTSKVKEMADNPELSAVKMIAKANPDVDIVAIDEENRTITLRNKKTGEEITVDFSDVKKGRGEFSSDDGRVLSVDAHGEGDEGFVRMESAEGSSTIGSGAVAEVPDWVPDYPGARVQGSYTSRVEGGFTGGFSFQTADAPGNVLTYYEVSLKGKGFSAESSTFQQNGVVTGGFLQAFREEAQRRVTVNVSQEEGQTQVVISYGEGG